MTININAKQIIKHVHLLLLVAILGLLLWSKPWDTGSTTAERTITVTGESTIEATPDEFTFYPYFEESGTDQVALQASLTQKANDAVDQLKQLGVAEEKITLDASSYDNWYYQAGEQGTLNVRLSIVVSDRDITQEVQDYLITLDVKGQISPQGTFSEALRKQLDTQAVEEASNDAKAKAQTQANLFNAELGKAITVTQGSDSIFYGFRAGIEPAIAEDTSTSSSLPVLPGQNDYRQTVTVIYELK